MRVKRWEAGSGHSYSIDKRRATGVTTALKALPKDLVGWAARSVADVVVNRPDHVMRMLDLDGPGPTHAYLSAVPTQIRNSAAVRGTKIHELAERVIRGDAVEVPDELRPYVESYIAFCDDWDPTPVLSETVVASREHMYAGTLDSIQDIPALGRVQVDYKTGKGLYGEAALQMAAYRYAEVYLDEDGHTQPMVEVEGCYVLHIRPEGYELVPMKSGPDTFRTFLAVLDVYRRAIQSSKGVKRLDSLVGEPLEPPAKEAAS